MSSVSTMPFPFVSLVRMKTLPCVSCFATSYLGEFCSNIVICLLLALLAYEVEISFFIPNLVKFAAKYLVKFDHSGSSHGQRIVLPRNTSLLYST